MGCAPEAGGLAGEVNFNETVRYAKENSDDQ
jgi:hypothetical protein